LRERKLTGRGYPPVRSPRTSIATCRFSGPAFHESSCRQVVV
jgi:hypothetical protein